jgi:hypothetical protein
MVGYCFFNDGGRGLFERASAYPTNVPPAVSSACPSAASVRRMSPTASRRALRKRAAAR